MGHLVIQMRDDLGAVGISQDPFPAVSILVGESTWWSRLQATCRAGANPRLYITGLTPLAAVTPHLLLLCLRHQFGSSGSWKPKGEAAQWGGQWGWAESHRRSFSFWSLVGEPLDKFCPIFKNWGCSSNTQLIICTHWAKFLKQN